MGAAARSDRPPRPPAPVGHLEPCCRCASHRLLSFPHLSSPPASRRSRRLSRAFSLRHLSRAFSLRRRPCERRRPATSSPLSTPLQTPDGPHLRAELGMIEAESHFFGSVSTKVSQRACFLGLWSRSRW